LKINININIIIIIIRKMLMKCLEAEHHKCEYAADGNQVIIEKQCYFYALILCFIFMFLFCSSFFLFEIRIPVLTKKGPRQIRVRLHSKSRKKCKFSILFLKLFRSFECKRTLIRQDWDYVYVVTL
jgi:hypothetical protein